MPMNFYYLEESIRTKETGDEYPQILKMIPRPDYHDDNGIYALSRVALPENEINLKYLILEKNAKPSDVLSCEMLRLRGFLMNERFRDTLENFNLPDHRFYPAFVKDVASKAYSYYWLQMVIDYTRKYIDFKKSDFEITSTSIIKKESMPVEINSNEEYIETKSKLPEKQRIRLSKVVLNKVFEQSNLDIFKIVDLSGSWIISERLKTAIAERNITGVTARPALDIIGVVG
jgi:hypothetical protein